MIKKERIELVCNALKQFSDLELVCVLKERMDAALASEVTEGDAILEESIAPTLVEDGVEVSNMNDEKKFFNVVCSVCKCNTTVPFEPKEDWPVYCRACYDKKKGGI